MGLRDITGNDNELDELMHSFFNPSLVIDHDSPPSNLVHIIAKAIPGIEPPALKPPPGVLQRRYTTLLNLPNAMLTDPDFTMTIQTHSWQWRTMSDKTREPRRADFHIDQCTFAQFHSSSPIILSSLNGQTYHVASYPHLCWHPPMPLPLSLMLEATSFFMRDINPSSSIAYRSVPIHLCTLSPHNHAPLVTGGVGGGRGRKWLAINLTSGKAPPFLRNLNIIQPRASGVGAVAHRESLSTVPTQSTTPYEDRAQQHSAIPGRKWTRELYLSAGAKLCALDHCIVADDVRLYNARVELSTPQFCDKEIRSTTLHYLSTLPEKLTSNMDGGGECVEGM
ncbi:hypothetical protein DFH27DRAFT_644974 [Peziza echinospora]|nr:hypothetical protein DFH27DRAFT_644974 [Peziza echinospora]